MNKINNDLLNNENIKSKIIELKNISRINSDENKFLESRLQLGVLSEKLGLYSDAERYYREINKNDIGEYFVKSRNDLGRLLEKLEKYEEAEMVYREVIRNDSPKDFAMLCINLGLLLSKLNKNIEAEKVYKEVKREDDKLQYAKSRINLGVLLKKQKRYEESEQVYKQVRRKDEKSLFAIAQMKLGILYDEWGKSEEAEKAYLKVKKEDNKECFAMAMFLLSELLNRKERYKEEELIHRIIQKEDSGEYFAKSRNNLGRLLEKFGKYEEAEKVYREVVREDSPKDFAILSINLGVLLSKLNRNIEAEKVYQEVRREYEEAELVYKEVERNDDKSLFAIAQMNLGILYSDWGKYKEAKKAYLNVKKEDDKEHFARARNNLGYLLNKRGKYKAAEKSYSEVGRDDSPKEFARASVNLGLLLDKQKRSDEAIKVLLDIKIEDSEYFFCRARFIIGSILVCKGKYSDAMTYFKYSKKVHSYESECFIRILESSNEFIEILKDLKEIVVSILNSLKLDNKNEDCICHYTRPSTAFSLLGFSGDDKQPSNLRLSTIKNVNDPKEGKILFDYLGFPNREIGLASFISCFTFNHDSLNQFRLYGKENNPEASGVSIVLRKDFFDEYSEFYNFIDYEGKELPISLPYLEENTNANNNEIKKLPVYRCIYIDQESDYIKLAKRNEIDFYRRGMSSKDFNDYLRTINEKTIETKNNLNKIKSILRNIIKNNINDDVFDVINYILLPLRFLVKHAAFEDEQECRIFFITNLFDKRIVSNVNEKSMYLKYEEAIGEYIDKIYLSIGASQYEDFFIRALRDSSKVCHSKNPFRNK